MADDSDKPESGAGEPKPPKIKAEDNPWYLLATLYGEPAEWDVVYVLNPQDEELRSKNRLAWNRYFGDSLDEKTQAHLIVRHGWEELKPLSPEEVEKAFAVRRGSKVSIALPPRNSRIDFTGVQFDQKIDFSHYIFIDCSFKGADFSDLAGFWDATFLKGANFSGATFSRVASFTDATFSGVVHFRGAIFSDAAIIQGATFSQKAYFESARFSGGANFYRAAFAERAYFAEAIYSNSADFARATFSLQASFAGVAFAASSTFVNTELKSTTSFEGAKFKTEPPHFFGTKLHQGTDWRSIEWPPKPKDKDYAKAFVDAYACLKLEMDRLNKHEDELDFFALELQSRRVLLGPWRGLPIAIYGAFSDFGRSYLRPLVALFYLALICTLAFLPSDAFSP